MNPDVAVLSELICLLTSSKPSADPLGHVKHGHWVSSGRTMKVHQHLMTAKIIKSIPVKTGLLPPIDTWTVSLLMFMSLKIQLMRARGGEVADLSINAVFDTKHCPGKGKGTQQQKACCSCSILFMPGEVSRYQNNAWVIFNSQSLIEKWSKQRNLSHFNVANRLLWQQKSI